MMTMGRLKTKKPVVPLRTKLRKDPGVPKLPDLKAKNEVKQRTRSSSHMSPRIDPDAVMASEPTLSSLAQLASEAEAASSSAQNLYTDPSSSGQGKTKEQLRKHYIRQLHKVIDESDIVILVLDARDPEGCRSRLVEEEVRRRESEGKKLVFVLNKVDLIPKANAQSWLKHLRHTTPTLPFLSPSSSHHQRSNISSSTAPSLLKLLKAYKPKAGSVTVGVVGYPNVGKSSLINSLKRNKVCPVAAQPGHTKELQSVSLERGMRIVDSPGVVFDEDDFDDGKGGKKGSVLLRNVVKVEDVEDPIEVVEEIFHRTSKETLQKIYNLPEFSSTLEFLTMLAMTSGRLLKGGTPDILSAARQVLTDWNHQKIPYFSEPPAIHPSLIPSTVPTSSDQTTTIAPGAESVGQAQVLTEFSKPFQLPGLEGLFGAADAGAFGGGSKDVNMDGDGDEGEEMFWDAEESFNAGNQDVDVEADEMMTDLVSRRTSLGKRPRSPSVTPSATIPALQSESGESRFHRLPKRLRKSQFRIDGDFDASSGHHNGIGSGNPLNRRTLKKERKRERKIARLAQKAANASAGDQEGNGGMEVDDVGGGLGFTFMA
ncbi:hypothetical protein K435DRAFT_753462 [Dendrothele bispora CBS 962.96]|uniref:CP-type G domain-containing protein n=1 Tax=Dendrothele bispora (strain CBS 962.96) TaxID=1314807 RepID=A0A4S8M6F7_DENBC|nr:hypothetical protein K435DRAFT_753462 [Dendrothele bispora CBS 962.96]